MGHAEQSEFALLEYLDKLVEDLRKLVSTAVHGEDVDAVHDARVATRRLKAAVDLMDRVLSGRCKKPFMKVTRTLRRQLGPLRDLDVMLEHVREIKDARFASSTAWLSERLEHCRREAVKSAEHDAPPARMLAKLGTWWGLRHEIVDAREEIDTLLAESVHTQLNEFAAQAGQLVKVMGEDVSADEPRNDPHQLRIAGKSLRYTLEMAAKHGKPLARAVMGHFKKMQEALGLWHDYIVLTERMLCETVDCDLALHNPGLQGEILGLAQAMLRKAQFNLKKMASLWAAQGEVLSGQIRTALAPGSGEVEKAADVPAAEPGVQESNLPAA